MTGAFGFSFIGKRSPFAFRNEFMYVTFHMEMPTLEKKDAIFFEYLEDSFLPMAQTGVLTHMETFEEIWYHAR